MRIKNVAVFAYDFPHKKTQDVILRLLVENYNVKYVLAAPWKKLNLAEPAVRISPSNIGLMHPKQICMRFKIKYLSVDHNSKKAIAFIRNNPVDLLIVSGARILSEDVIAAAKGKILNIHPGLLPENRGLDTLQWCISDDVPMGVTAHLIVPKIDAGLLIAKKNLPLKKTDTPLDVSLRLLEIQNEFLIESLNILKKKKIQDLTSLNNKKGRYNTKMPAKMEIRIMKRFASWLKTHVNTD